MITFHAIMKRLCLAALALVLFAAVSACGRVVMKSIPAELIPEDLKNEIQAMGSKDRPVSNIVWRVYEIKDRRLLAACTFAQQWEPGVKTDMFWIWSADIDEDGNRGSGMGGGGGFDATQPFYGMPGSESELSETGEPEYSLRAVGYCLESRVEVIKGTTSEGKTVETTPSGGFWHLVLDHTGTNERWTRISALDKKGRVVAELTISP